MVTRLAEWERRRPMWLRCLVWAVLVFHLYFAIVWVLRPYDLPFLWALAPTMLAALLVGMHLRSWAWAGIPLAFGAVVAALGAMMALGGASDSGTPGAGSIVQGIGVAYIYFGAVIGITFGVPAALGVWWGRRRHAASADSHGAHPEDDPAT